MCAVKHINKPLKPPEYQINIFVMKQECLFLCIKHVIHVNKTHIVVCLMEIDSSIYLLITSLHSYVPCSSFRGLENSTVRVKVDRMVMGKQI